MRNGGDDDGHNRVGSGLISPLLLLPTVSGTTYLLTHLPTYLPPSYLLADIHVPPSTFPLMAFPRVLKLYLFTYPASDLKDVLASDSGLVHCLARGLLANCPLYPPLEIQFYEDTKQ